MTRFERLMRRLGWVRRSELEKLLVQHVGLLEEHERMIRLAQTLLRQTEQAVAPAETAAAARGAKAAGMDAAEPAAEAIVVKPKPASKLH